AEHLDYHGSLQSYITAKSRIAGHMATDGVLVFNRNNSFVAELASRVKCRVAPFMDTLPFSMEGIALRGRHNELNIAAALTVAELFHVSGDVAHEAVKNFTPLPHRLEYIGEFRGIKFYDDAIATAPEPTMFAIETLGNVDTIFLGGTDRGLDFTQLAKAICMAGIRNAVLFPDTGARIKDALNQHCDRKLNLMETSSMDEAVKFAYVQTREGKSCLLSTASPSYSLWKNFEEKGSEFKKSVLFQGSETDLDNHHRVAE
ncbi:MAG TPA: Mur ligase family protein, partial [Candidatus Saccharimonadia bacterium]|nr:Mur ligase family protein [Candidatus Saccharimonadia bacterium]